MPKPDFFVIGGQKCGSTELCSSIASHPGVSFSRPKELFFFCRDDVDILPYPFFEHEAEWALFDWKSRSNQLLEEYEGRFQKTKDQLCGEGTPLYLPSQRAASRIRETYPDAKLIVILRNPTERAYSAYWHHLKVRRSTQSFENHLRYEAGGSLSFGRYLEQLKFYLGLFSLKQIHIVLFEDYIANRRHTVSGVFEFLGLPPFDIGVGDRNAAQVPRFQRAQRFLNALTRTYSSHGETVEYDIPRERGALELAVSGALRSVGSLNLTGAKYESMRPETRVKLNAYYRRENDGLSDLIGLDVAAAWGW